MSLEALFIGVDVGTSSVRSALVTDKGKILKTAVENIQIWNPRPDFYEQSSADIWRACIRCIQVFDAIVVFYFIYKNVLKFIHRESRKELSLQKSKESVSTRLVPSLS